MATERKKLSGYPNHMSVFEVSSCPANRTLWNQRAKVLGCNLEIKPPFTGFYYCIPNKSKTKLVEFCYDKSSSGTTKGVCTELGDDGHLHFHNCMAFVDGCPSKGYLTETIYEYQACMQIDTTSTCYLAERGCHPFSSISTTPHSPHSLSTQYSTTNSTPAESDFSYVRNNYTTNISQSSTWSSPASDYSITPNTYSTQQPTIPHNYQTAFIVMSILFALLLFISFLLFMYLKWKSAKRGTVGREYNRNGSIEMEELLKTAREDPCDIEGMIEVAQGVPKVNLFGPSQVTFGESVNFIAEIESGSLRESMEWEVSTKTTTRRIPLHFNDHKYTATTTSASSCVLRIHKTDFKDNDVSYRFLMPIDLDQNVFLKSNTISLTIMGDKPTITISGIILQRKTLKIVCKVTVTVDSLAINSIRWTKNNGVIDTSRNQSKYGDICLENHTLEIKDLEFADIGKYQCIVGNAVGESKSDVLDLGEIWILSPEVRTVLCCLTFQKHFKINLNNDLWINGIKLSSEFFGCEVYSKKDLIAILKDSDAQLHKYIHCINDIVQFKSPYIRNTTVLTFAKHIGFAKVFLGNADIENIKEYCRTPNYRAKEGESCFHLDKEEMEMFIEKLQYDILNHCTMDDVASHDVIARKMKIPLEILKQGRKGITNYLELLKRGRVQVFHARGMIVGCAGAGKTSLLKKLKDFSIEEILNTEPTRGVDIQEDVFTIKEDCITVSPQKLSSHFGIKESKLNSEKRNVKTTEETKSFKDESTIDLKEQQMTTQDSAKHDKVLSEENFLEHADIHLTDSKRKVDSNITKNGRMHGLPPYSMHTHKANVEMIQSVEKQASENRYVQKEEKLSFTKKSNQASSSEVKEIDVTHVDDNRHDEGISKAIVVSGAEYERQSDSNETSDNSMYSNEANVNKSKNIVQKSSDVSEDMKQVSLSYDSKEIPKEGTNTTNEKKTTFYSKNKLQPMHSLACLSNLNDPVPKTITFLDFAGQFAYYVTHQMFLSPRAFYVLVMDMTKSLTELVTEDSRFIKWKYKDFIEHWMKLLHAYHSSTTPVILVASHSEGKTDEEIKRFFLSIWTLLPDDLKRHLSLEREFAVELREKTNIPEMKKCIFDLVQSQMHWGEERPSVWVHFEKLLQNCKAKHKIIKTSDIWEQNQNLDENIRLQQEEDMVYMLDFFHDTGIILFFKDLKDLVIVDVQWFIDAFKHIITDPLHAKEDLRKIEVEEMNSGCLSNSHVAAWEKFKDTGILSTDLRNAIWKIYDNSYKDYEDDIMIYMERIGMLANLKTNPNTWYVPCMNTRPLPANSFKETYVASPTLCFQCQFLPSIIYYRLVASCLSELGFNIPKEGHQRTECLYANAVILQNVDFKDTCYILLGNIRNVIEIQFLSYGKLDIDKRKSANLKIMIFNRLKLLMQTFHTNLEDIITGYRCKNSIFCENPDSHVIPEENFKYGETLKCTTCLLPNQTMINADDVLNFWNQDKRKLEKSRGHLNEKNISDDNKDLLKRIPELTLVTSFHVLDFQQCRHISCISSDIAWITDQTGTMKLVNTDGNTLKTVDGIKAAWAGAHTVTKEGKFLFIDLKSNVFRMEDNKWIKHLDISPHKRQCIYSSSLNGDILLTGRDEIRASVLRYNASGHLKQEIEKDGERELYSDPIHIAENINGDILVSDMGRGLVVVDKFGIHRSTYKGQASEYPFRAHGISTDTFGIILVCDLSNEYIHVLNLDVEFLDFIRVREDGIRRPRCLCMDNIGRLWIGDHWTGKIGVYKYLQGH